MNLHRIVTIWSGGLVLFCSLLVPLFGVAQESLILPVPMLTDERLYLVGETSQDYEEVRHTLNELKGSQQTYFVIVVESVGPGSNAAKDYADRIWETWAGSISRQQQPLSPGRAMLMLLAEKEKLISVRCGSVLQEEFGLKEDRINRELVNPVFLPHARNGDYNAGLSALLSGTEKWIADKDQPALAPAVAPARTPKTESSPAQSTQTATPQVTPQQSSSWFWPITILGIIAIGSVLVIAWKPLRQKQLFKAVTNELERYSAQTVKWLDEIEALKKRHQVLAFVDDQPVTGVTLASHRQFESVLEQLQACWLAKMEVRTEAEKLLLPQTETNINDLKATLKALRSTSFEDAEALHQQCVGQLDELENARQNAAKKIAEFPKLLAALEQTELRLTETQLPIAAYRPTIDGLKETFQTASQTAPLDPIGCIRTLDESTQTGQQLKQRMEQILVLSEEGKSLEQQLASTREEAARHRAAGLKLHEENGNPDRHFQDAQAACSELTEAIHSGDVAQAENHLASIKQSASQATRVIRDTLEARAFCERELPSCRQQIDRLQAALSQAKEHRQRLSDEFAPESWQPIANHLDRALEAMENLRDWEQDATHKSALQNQSYLQAQRLIQQIRKEHEQTSGLLQAVDRRLAELTELRRRCKDNSERVFDRIRDAERWFDQHRRVLSREIREALVGLSRRCASLRSSMGRSAPNWTEVETNLTSLTNHLEEVWIKGKEEVAAHEQCQKLMDQTRHSLQRIGEELRRQTTDRQVANDRFAAAESAYQRASQTASEEHADWQSLCRAFQEIQEDLSQVQQLAREDARLSQLAGDELTKAEQAINRAKSFSSQGFTADISSARREYEAARQSLSRQDYEAAIREAGSAQRSARSAVDAAESQARARQRELDAQRFQALSTAAHTPSTSATPQSQPAKPEGESPSTDSTGTSTQSWSTGTSQTGW